MNPKSIRYKQRFTNFEKAFLQLKIAIDRFDELDDLALEGLVQRFEYTFELAWKTLKDYNESEGFITQTPRETIKQAFQAGILDNGELWIEMLDKRNLMAHTYQESTFKEVIHSIKEHYFGQIEELYEFFKNKQKN